MRSPVAMSLINVILSLSALTLTLTLTAAGASASNDKQYSLYRPRHIIQDEPIIDYSHPTQHSHAQPQPASSSSSSRDDDIAEVDVDSLLSIVRTQSSKPSPLPHDLLAPMGGAPWRGKNMYDKAALERRKKMAEERAKNINLQDGPIRDTQYGQVQGYTQNGDVNIWRGIPFAAPPVGNLRWREPQDAQNWTGVKQTTWQANICPQIHIFDWLYLGNEDCLYLDVYAPVNANSSNPLPVFIWIYGGGYVIGDNWEFGFYDGYNVVRQRGHIVVSMNYRLGPLGFMANDALRDDNPHGFAGNWGILDQLKAMQWVRDNIANFGGDPNRVTIGGESAGAFSTCFHLASPLSAGLFHAAILESGTCNTQNFFVDYDVQRNWTNTYAAMVGCDPDAANILECLRAVPTGKIMGHILGKEGKSLQENVRLLHEAHARAAQGSKWNYKPRLFPLMPWGTTIDGVALLRQPLEQIISGQYNKVPVIMGTNNDEGTIFVPVMPLIIIGTHFPAQITDLPLVVDHMFGGLGNTSTVLAGIQQLYPLSAFKDAEDMLSAVLRDFMFVCSSRRAVRAMTQHNASAWLYHWWYKGDWIEDLFLGDYHTAELEFVWNNAWPPFIHMFSDNDAKMADTVDTYWTNLIHYHNPNGPEMATSGDHRTHSSSKPNSPFLRGQLYWPRWDASSMNDMILALPTSVEDDYYGKQCDFWDTLKDA